MATKKKAAAPAKAPAPRRIPAPAARKAATPTKAPAPARKPPTPARAALKVRATQMGYYGDERRRPGSVFTLTSARHFSEKWMEWVDPNQPELKITAEEAMRLQHDEILGAKYADQNPDAVRPGLDADPIGATTE